jgi:hypothetical protein
VKAELRSLPRTLADLVAQHLVASGRFLDDDPELAYLHAKTARRLAARLGGVREAVAITAYLSEHYDEALTEFRAVRRMTGNHEVLPAMADCERALGRPEKALALSREKQVIGLEEGSQIEMLIVAAGARRDMGQTAAAIQTLEIPELTKRTRADWLPRLRYAYADALAEAGRTEEALVWFHRAAGADADGSTGAAERAAELEGLQFTDLGEDEDDTDTDTVIDEVGDDQDETEPDVDPDDEPEADDNAAADEDDSEDGDNVGDDEDDSDDDADEADSDDDNSADDEADSDQADDEADSDDESDEADSDEADDEADSDDESDEDDSDDDADDEAGSGDGADLGAGDVGGEVDSAGEADDDEQVDGKPTD